MLASLLKISKNQIGKKVLFLFFIYLIVPDFQTKCGKSDILQKFKNKKQVNK